MCLAHESGTIWSRRDSQNDISWLERLKAYLNSPPRRRASSIISELASIIARFDLAIVNWCSVSSCLAREACSRWVCTPENPSEQEKSVVSATRIKGPSELEESTTYDPIDLLDQQPQSVRDLLSLLVNIFRLPLLLPLAIVGYGRIKRCDERSERSQIKAGG
jgi:hypothetical protein